VNASKKTKTAAKKPSAILKKPTAKNLVSKADKATVGSKATNLSRSKPSTAKKVTGTAGKKDTKAPIRAPKGSNTAKARVSKTTAKKLTPKIQASKKTKPASTKPIEKKAVKIPAKGKPIAEKKKPVTPKPVTPKPVIPKPVAPKPVAAKTSIPSPPAKAKAVVATKVGVETKKPIKAGAKVLAEKLPTNNVKAPIVAAVKPPVVSQPKEPVPPPSDTKPEIVAKIRSAQAGKELRKDLAQPAAKTSLTPLNPVPPIVKGKDRLILMVRDPYWIHAHWDIMRHSVDRAKAALAENWHTVKPILRLLKLDDSGTTNNSEVIHRDIEIHGGVRNWYIDVDSPPSRFKLLMGYLCANGRFYELARSNIVLTPAPGGKEATDDHWADIATDAEHIYSMSGGYGDDTQTGDLTEVFEERLKRTMDADVLSQFGSGAEGSLKRHKQFHFDVNAELVVFGSTHPEAHVSVGIEPVKVRSDGSFSIRLPLPDRRQVLPATAKSRDGVDEQTVVIAVERNTKVMEPLSTDSDD